MRAYGHVDSPFAAAAPHGPAKPASVASHLGPQVPCRLQRMPSLAVPAGGPRCGLTLRSSGPPPASHLGREAPWSMLRLAAQVPSRWGPLSSNVRPRSKLQASAPATRKCNASRVGA